MSKLIKLYGETHSHQGNVKAYSSIFESAYIEGIKICFIERSPIDAPRYDEYCSSFSGLTTDKIDNVLSKLKTADGIFLSALSVKYNIKLVCADVGYDSVALMAALYLKFGPSRTKTDTEMEKFLAEFLSVDIAAIDKLYGPLEAGLRKDFEEFKEGLTSYSQLYYKLYQEIHKRFETDYQVAQYIYDRIPHGEKAIAIWGGGHLNPMRESCLTYELMKLDQIEVQPFNIFCDGKVVQFPHAIDEKTIDDYLLTNLMLLSVCDDQLIAEIKNKDAHAYYEVGLIYDDKQSPNYDMREACLWFHRAAQAGSMAAQFQMGTRYVNQMGSSIDTRIGWLQKAADQGMTKARSLLADLLSVADSIK